MRIDCLVFAFSAVVKIRGLCVLGGFRGVHVVDPSSEYSWFNSGEPPSSGRVKPICTEVDVEDIKSITGAAGVPAIIVKEADAGLSPLALVAFKNTLYVLPISSPGRSNGLSMLFVAVKVTPSKEYL
jgi:hypothetical protein